ncbi:MAG: helix-turn-helix domain-containing protein [Rickettsiales bacterium]
MAFTKSAHMHESGLPDSPERHEEELAEVSRALKNRRAALGLSAEDVAAALRVKSRYIEAMETNQWENLAHLYLIGYVKTYASYLHLDDAPLTAAVKRWQEKEHPYTLVVRDAGREKERKEYVAHGKTIPRASAALFIAPLLLAGGYWSYSHFLEKPPSSRVRASVSPGASRHASDKKALTTGAQKDASSAPKRKKAGKSKNYIIHSGEYAAVKVYDDHDKLRDEMRLTPGEAYFLTLPDGGYVLSSGDASLVDVYSDDMSVRLGDIGMLQAKKHD